METAIKIEPGATYVIETNQYLSDRIKLKMQKNLKVEAPTNTFIILDGGMKIAKHRKEDGGKEERSRKFDVNEHIKSDWAVEAPERPEVDNEEGSMCDPEHIVQHDEAWEDYIRMEREARVRREAEGKEARKSSLEIGNLADHLRISGRRNPSKHSEGIISISRLLQGDN